MPIYRYECPECEEEVEIIHSMSGLDLPQICKCGFVMKRLVSTFSFSFPVSNRSRVLKALNGEVSLPAADGDRPRIEQALAKGLDRNRRVIGKGI